LQAPEIFTAGETSSSRPTVVTLCGMVISAPAILLSVNTDFRKAGKCSAWQPMGTTTASTPAFSNQGL